MFKPRPYCQVKYHKIYYVVFCFIKDADLSGIYHSFPFGHFIFLWPFANYLAVWYPLLQKERKFHLYQSMQGRIQNLVKYLRRGVLQKYLMAFASCCNYFRETLHLRCVAGFWMRLSYGTQKKLLPGRLPSTLTQTLTLTRGRGDMMSSFPATTSVNPVSITIASSSCSKLLSLPLFLWFFQSQQDHWNVDYHLQIINKITRNFLHITYFHTSH